MMGAFSSARAGSQEVSRALERHCRTFATDESGATAIEYGLIAALIFIALLAALINLNVGVTDMYNWVLSNFLDAANQS